MKVKIKKLHVDAVIPKYAKQGDAGMDLTAVDVHYDKEDDCLVYDTGLSMEIPKGYVGLVFPRSSLSKIDLLQTNHVGVIDSGYRGPIKVKFKTLFNYWEVSKDEDFQERLVEGSFDFYDRAEDTHYNKQLSAKIYATGERIGQIMIIPYPEIEFEEVEELTITERGNGGFGSTGKV